MVTLNPAQPSAGAIAVTGDRISLVADNTQIESVTGPGSRVIDCAGKTLVPGFNDAHCHIFSFIRKLLSIDLSPPGVSSIADIKMKVFQAAQKTPAGQWIIGTDYNDFYLAERRHPTRRDIDEVAPEHPVVLCHRSLHACVLNSRALALAGIGMETEERPGTSIERELDSGEPSGLLFEMLGHIRSEVLPPLSETELKEGIASANHHYLSQGITSLQEATVTNDLSRWQKYRYFKENGMLKSRLSVMCGLGAVKEFQQAGVTFGSDDIRLRLGGIKIVLTDAPGEVFPPQEELNRQALEAHQAGMQIAIHAVRMETVEAAITALEYAQEQIALEGRRHRIEHCSECPPALLERLSRLPVAVVTQPPFLHYSGERYLATVPRERLPWLYRIKSFMGAGLVVASSSDSPIVPENPLVGIYAAVTRRATTGQTVLTQEGVSVEQALAMYTINGAYASFEERIKGSITPGKLADMALLSNDPAKVPLEKIKNIKVEKTIIGGEVVWEG